MGERGPQTRGPREIEDFVGWEMQGREMGCLGAEDPSAIRNQSSGGMTRLTLRVPRLLAPFCGGETSLPVTGSDVRAALEDAMARHPLLRTHLLDERGLVREHLHLFLNEMDVRDALATTTHEGDELYVLQAMSGGSGQPARSRAAGRGAAPRPA